MTPDGAASVEFNSSSQNLIIPGRTGRFSQNSQNTSATRPPTSARLSSLTIVISLSEGFRDDIPL
ncbi:hypothetical protein EYF80_064692 [Liparis tanakae]|uniref:Uncharacterized protein n=1 Tax=Liparis tanakae TaxID=230148 RepID=A0A4Z2E9D5_9TELE|nr:hypothetical protein EYF80_064692 [Liparis tanakae]